MLGAWCWDTTIKELASYGTEAVAFDLPGHGDDRTPRVSITAADYVRIIVGHIDSASSPVILVGHSMAGYAIAKAAVERPGRVKHLVYFSAQARVFGQSWADTLDPDVRATYEESAAERGDGSYVVPESVVTTRWLSSLAPDSPLADSIRSRLTPQPARPLFEPWDLHAGALADMPVTYVWPVDDKQNNNRRMRMSLSNLPGATRLVRIGGDHCAMLSNPKETAAVINDVATRYPG